MPTHNNYSHRNKGREEFNDKMSHYIDDPSRGRLQPDDIFEEDDDYSDGFGLTERRSNANRMEMEDEG